MSATGVADIPIKDDLIDALKKMNGTWFRWISAVLTRLLACVQTVASVHRTGLAASIAAVTIYTPAQPATFRVSWSLQVKTPGTVSSSIAVTLSWKSETANIAQSEAFTAITGNTTATHGSGSIVIRPNSGQPIQYATTYASVGATSMAYDLDVAVEELT